MQAAIQKSYSADIQMEQGSGGVFQVKVDGELIFDKWDVGRFPEDQEILDRLATKQKKTP